MMFGWRLTRKKKPETPPEVVPERLSATVNRLVIEVEELRLMCEATWARQRKVEGAVHGMRGASRRWPQSGTDDESIEEFRDRMVREGRLQATRGGNSNGG